MINIPVKNTAGEILEELQIEEAALGGKVRQDLLRQAVLTYESNQRVGTAKTKTRGEDAHSDRKPWPQKGTGRARAGTRSSPLWVGGATTFGPQPRDYSKKLNKKMRRKALAAAVLGKALSDEIIVVDQLELPEPKTREMASILENLGVERTFLVVLSEHNEILWRCTKNIPGSSMRVARELNSYEVIRPQKVIFTREAWREAIDNLAKTRVEDSETAAADTE
ncbi:MAG: 50S ribosomal protein L4 [Candidatus Brocadiia bacterium]